MRKRSGIRHMMLASGLPEDALSDCARVTMTGQSAVLVEGQHGVIELTQEQIRLNTGGGVLTVTGVELHLRELSVDAAMIAGDCVTSISYDQMRTRRGTGRVSDA